MTTQEVNGVAKKVSCTQLGSTGTLNVCSYLERPTAAVSVLFLNKRVILVATLGPDRSFSTTTGIETWGLAGNAPIPGSTEDDFVKSAPGVTCSKYPSRGATGDHICAYEHPHSRYTFALTSYEHEKEWPAPDYYVGALGVATQEAYELYLQSGL
jgi:hypothetical protein